MMLLRNLLLNGPSLCQVLICGKEKEENTSFVVLLFTAIAGTLGS